MIGFLVSGLLAGIVGFISAIVIGLTWWQAALAYILCGSLGLLSNATVVYILVRLAASKSVTKQKPRIETN